MPEQNLAHPAASFAGGSFDRVKDLLFAAWDHVVGSDPGLLRLRFAVRAVLSVAATTLCLLALYRVLPLPQTVMAPGVIVALFSSIAIRDPTIAAQKRSFALAPLTTFLSYASAALLAEYPYVADAVFLAVVFLAVYVRRFGQRWGGAGMIAYISFFLGQYLHPSAAQLVWIPLPLAIGTLLSYRVRFHVTHDDPRAVALRILAAVEVRIADLLAGVRSAVQAGGADARARERIARRVEALNEAGRNGGPAARSRRPKRSGRRRARGPSASAC